MRGVTINFGDFGSGLYFVLVGWNACSFLLGCLQLRVSLDTICIISLYVRLVTILVVINHSSLSSRVITIMIVN